MLLRPIDQDNTFAPLFCPHCKFAMRHSSDYISFVEVGGCNQCDIKFLRTKRTLSAEEMNEYVEFRKKMFRSPIAFK